jgi:dTDP-4-dehydrorhamnose 3,5-epimerase
MEESVTQVTSREEPHPMPGFTATATTLPGVVLIETPLYRDARGHFLEVWRADRYAEAGVPGPFVQDNLSWSTRGVLRGLHFQHPGAQGKLVGPLAGAIYDVVVDVRAGSLTFGRWEGFVLDAAQGRQVYVPEGFAHGFAVTSETALVLYKCTALYRPGAEGSVRWDDPDLGIAWPVADPVLSDKDRAAPRLAEIPAERLPRWDGPA